MLNSRIVIQIQPYGDGYAVDITDRNAVPPAPQTVQHVTMTVADAAAKVSAYLATVPETPVGAVRVLSSPALEPVAEPAP